MTEKDYIEIILFIESKCKRKANVLATFPHLRVSFGLEGELFIPSAFASSIAHIKSAGFKDPGAPTDEELERDAKRFSDSIDRMRHVKD